MGIFKREHPVATRQELEAYLDYGKGQIDARIRREEQVVEPVSATVDLEHDQVTEQRGYYVRHTAENGEKLTMFVPADWQPGRPAPPEAPPYFLGPEDQLPVEGLKVVVLSRREVAAEAPMAQ